MVYEEVDIADMDFDEQTGVYTYLCPCGDYFRITTEELEDGEDIAHCPSCSLVIRVLYDLESDDDDEHTGGREDECGGCRADISNSIESKLGDLDVERKVLFGP
eukprot:COSAG06_NODE_28569_length_572_cov_0.613108_1_plen_104_part_00